MEPFTGWNLYATLLLGFIVDRPIKVSSQYASTVKKATSVLEIIWRGIIRKETEHKIANINRKRINHEIAPV